ncbi:MAG: efflux RND transporter permease subunit [Bacteroidales bacterium]
MKLPIQSIKRPAGTIILMVALMVVGVMGYMRLPVNMLPDITYPLIKVYVYWPGADPEQIENEVAQVIERKMATVDNLDYIESTSEDGLYSLLVNFDYTVNRDVAYQDVLAKMGLVRKELPKEVEEPVIFKADPSQLPVVDLLITDENKSITQLRTWVENELQDKFSSVKGSAGTAISGGTPREIRVHVDPLKLQGYNISVSQVIKRLKEENLDIPGGKMITPTRDFLIRTYGEFQNINDIKNLIITRSASGANILLKDIAEVKDFHAIQKVRNRFNGKEGVRLSIFKQAEANAVEVSDNVKKRLAELSNELPPSVKIDMIYDQAEYIRMSTHGVRDAVAIAAIFVVLVTAFFLTGWKRILTLVLTLPVTILGTFFLMQLLGFSINIFTLGGLVVAMSVILDNAIVMIENITRIHETEPHEPTPVQKGAVQITGAIVTATVTFLSLFIPFLLVPGLTSLLFTELIITVAIVILLSMIVSLTLNPTLMALFYSEGKPVEINHTIITRLSSKLIDGLIRIYKPILRWSLKMRWLVLLIFVLLMVPGYYYLTKTGSEFLPKADDGLITVKVIMPTGTSMEQTDKVLKKVEEILSNQPYIDSYSTLAGGHIWGLVTYENGYEGEVDIQLVPPSKRPMNTDKYVEKLRPEIMKAIKVPGAIVKVMHTKMKGIKQTGQFDIEVEVLAPRSEPMTKIFKTASDIAAIMRQKDYLTGVDVSLRLTKPEYQIVVDRQKAFDLGLSLDDIANAVKTMVGGNVPTYYKEGAYYYPIRVVMNEKEITSQQDLENIYIQSPKGAKIPLSAIANVELKAGPMQIDRKNQDRVIKATANVTGISVGDATTALKKDLEKLQFPVGYKLNYGGQSQMLAENMQQMLIILALALFLAYVVMVLYFESFIKPFIIIIRIPLSLAGISYALYLTGTPMSVTAVIGIIMLTGMEVNNGVLLLTFIDELVASGENVWDAIIKAATIRLRPILITAINGFAGLMPLALTLGDGTEMLKPMAIVVIGGLLIGLLLVFIFIPVVYLILYGKKNVVNVPIN